MQDQPKSRIDLLGLFVILVIFVGLVLLIFPTQRGTHNPSARLRDGAQLKHVHLAARDYLDSTDEGSVPPTWAVLVSTDRIVPQILCSRNGYIRESWIHTLKIGSLSYVDLQTASIAESTIFEQVPSELLERTWEQLGEVMLSREHAAFHYDNNDLVAGFWLVPSEGPYERVTAGTSFVFASNQVSHVPILLEGDQTPEYLEMLAADRAARAELGLSPPPDYAALIREYITEMESK